MLAVLFAGTTALAGDVEFNRDIRPILSDRCYACHGPDKGNRKTKMRLDIEADAKADSARVASPSSPASPEKSEVYRRITSTNKAQRMPPAYMGQDPLPREQIDLIRPWIEQGAKYEPHWSFIPPRKAPLPARSGHGVAEKRYRLFRPGAASNARI